MTVSRVQLDLYPVPDAGQRAATRGALRLWCKRRGIAREPRHIACAFNQAAKPSGRFGMRVS